MAIIEINRNPSRRELLWFGGLLGGFLIVVGAVLYWRFDMDATAYALWIAGPLVATLYYGLPSIRKPVYLAWMHAAFPIGWAVSHLLFAIVYYLVLTPIALALRLGGREVVTRRFDRAAATHWIERRRVEDPARYFKQF